MRFGYFQSVGPRSHGCSAGETAIVGLRAYGAEGVQSVLEMLQTGVGRTMGMCGKPSIKSIDRTAVKIHEA
jgi:isopentenyl diphosphate isomerase/L-lactate dehydrogenase-like FMN-dependent dehydrogenase